MKKKASKKKQGKKQKVLCPDSGHNLFGRFRLSGLFSSPGDQESKSKYQGKTKRSGLKNRKKGILRRQHAKTIPHNSVTWILLAIFILGTCISLPVYLYQLFTLNAEKKLTVIVPVLPAGEKGYVYVKFAGEKPAGSISAIAQITTKKRTQTFQTKLDEKGAGIITVNLNSIPAGNADLTVKVKDLILTKRIQITAPDELRLWATIQTSGKKKILKALFNIKSRVKNTFPVQQKNVCFKLFGPRGNITACESTLTDKYGMASFSRRLATRFQKNRFKLEVSTGSESLNLDIPDLKTAIKPGPNTNTIPGSDSDSPVKPNVNVSGKIQIKTTKNIFVPGETLKLSLLCPAGEQQDFVVELLSGSIPLKSFLGRFQDGRADLSIHIPENALKNFFIRAWPLLKDAKKLFTWIPVNIKAQKQDILKAEQTKGPFISLLNTNETGPVSVYKMEGDHAPYFACNTPSSLNNIPFGATADTDISKALPALKILHFWKGFLLFLFSIPLLYGFASLLSSFKNKGFASFLFIILILYILTTINYPFFGTAVIASGLSIIYCSFRATFKNLPVKYRTSFRWIIPLLCIAPYLGLFLPISPYLENTEHEKKLENKGKITPLLQAVPSGKQLELNPQTLFKQSYSLEGDSLFFYAIDRSGRAETIQFNKTVQPFLSLNLSLPGSLTGGDRYIDGDEISCHVNVINRGKKKWTGSFSFEGDNQILSCKPGSSVSNISILPLGALRTSIMIKARKPGKGTLYISWNGTINGDKEFTLNVNPRGHTRNTVWNGLSQSSGIKGCSGFTSPFFLPQNVIYSTSKLEARLFPGPLSQILTVMEGASKLPWSDVEKKTAIAHSACLALTYFALTGQHSMLESSLNDRLSSELLDLSSFQKRNGSFPRQACSDDYVKTTAQVMLMLHDLQTIWPVKIALLEQAEEFLVSLVRIDGSFRSGSLSRPVEKNDILETCLAASALAEKTPEVTRSFLKHKLNDETEQAILAPVLCACKLSKALPQDIITRKIRRIERLPQPQFSGHDDNCAWWVYGLCESGAIPEIAQKALAILSRERDYTGAFQTLLINQFFLRSLILCSGPGPRVTNNTYNFDINKVLRMRKKQEIGPGKEDVPCIVNLTDCLHPSEKNIVHVQSSGSMFTPYQVLFSYAIPYKKDITISKYFKIESNYRETTLNLGQSSLLTLTLENLTDKDIDSARILLPMPSNLEIDKLPKTLKYLSGRRLPGETILLTTDLLKAATISTFHIIIKARFTGKAYSRPVCAFPRDMENSKAFSRPDFIIVLSHP